MQQFGSQDWRSGRVREWLLLLLRFATTHNAKDQAAVLAMADEIDALGQQRRPSAPSFFRRTSGEVSAAITARDDPKRAAILKKHIARIDDPRLRRVFRAAVDLERESRLAAGGTNGKTSGKVCQADRVLSRVPSRQGTFRFRTSQSALSRRQMTLAGVFLQVRPRVELMCQHEDVQHCVFLAAISADGWRRDRNERAGQGISLYHASAGRRDVLLKAAMVPTETCGPMSALGHDRPRRSMPHAHACPLRPESRQKADVSGCPLRAITRSRRPERKLVGMTKE